MSRPHSFLLQSFTSVQKIEDDFCNGLLKICPWTDCTYSQNKIQCILSQAEWMRKLRLDCGTLVLLKHVQRAVLSALEGAAAMTHQKSWSSRWALRGYLTIGVFEEGLEDSFQTYPGQQQGENTSCRVQRTELSNYTRVNKTVQSEIQLITFLEYFIYI